MTSTQGAPLLPTLLSGLVAAAALLACSGGPDGGDNTGADGGATGSPPRLDAGADGDAGPPICTPEAYVYCRCADGGVGTKKCTGGYFEPCVCE